MKEFTRRLFLTAEVLNLSKDDRCDWYKNMHSDLSSKFAEHHLKENLEDLEIHKEDFINGVNPTEEKTKEDIRKQEMKIKTRIFLSDVGGKALGAICTVLIAYAAIAAARKEGYSDGHNDGYSNGFSSGKNTGYKNGYEDGEYYGYARGFSDGDDYGSLQ